MRATVMIFMECVSASHIHGVCVCYCHDIHGVCECYCHDIHGVCVSATVMIFMECVSTTVMISLKYVEVLQSCFHGEWGSVVMFTESGGVLLSRFYEDCTTVTPLWRV